ncbi:hypothetical protein ID858_16935 [Xenorhabdus sp. DI]|nr:hypothetical protein [Xenorhabdus sp. 3]MBD2790178.1 hypothetical protein [Xenorhabdus sp. DI]
MLAKLDIVTKDDKQERIAKDAVNFTPLEKPAGLLIFDDVFFASKETIHRFFPSGQGPVNLPDYAIGQLRKSATELIYDPNIETTQGLVVSGHSAGVDTDRGTTADYFRLGRSGYGHAVKLDETKLQTTVTHKHTGKITHYTYTLNPKRVLVNLSSDYNSTKVDPASIDKKSCANNDAKVGTYKDDKFKPVYLSEVIASGGRKGSTLLDEYPSILSWSLIQGSKESISSTNSVVLVNDDTDDKQIGFDLSKNEKVNTIPANAMLLCKLYS